MTTFNLTTVKDVLSKFKLDYKFISNHVTYLYDTSINSWVIVINLKQYNQDNVLKKKPSTLYVPIAYNNIPIVVKF